jgi:hypothetical protein
MCEVVASDFLKRLGEDHVLNRSNSSIYSRWGKAA